MNNNLQDLLISSAAALERFGESELSKFLLSYANSLDKNQREQEYYKALHDAAEQKNPTLRWFMSSDAKEAGLAPPKLAYNGDAGVDLRYFGSEPLEIPPGENRPIPTGIGFEIPSGWYGKISNRTSVGRRGLIPVAQVVDSNFTGILTLTLHNLNRDQVVVLEPGERCAQIVFMPHWSKEISEIAIEDVKKTDRGSGAYGSSGKH